MEIALLLNFLFDFIGQCGKKVKASGAFDFVDAYSRSLHASTDKAVGHQESDAAHGAGIWSEDYFEEAFWDCHP